MTWTGEEAEAHLASLELFGMRLGLGRMVALMGALGDPQLRMPAVHVVGTNGKSSTTRMTAALLTAHGLRVGTYVSPHLRRWAERIQIDGQDLGEAEFGAAIGRAAAAARTVEEALPDGERVTQFELLTAAALDELARQQVDVAVIEAGLGARHDATAVVQAPVHVLTSVGLEHTAILGDTLQAIAAEKLATVDPGSTLVVGALAPEARAEVEQVVSERAVRLVEAVVDDAPAPPGYQRANFGIARAAATAFHGPLDAGKVADVARSVQIPGRLMQVGVDPLTILDGAHNPDGIRALVSALPELLGDRRPIVVLSVLEDKDVDGMLGAIAPSCARAVLCRCANPRALDADALLARWRHTSDRPAEAVADPHAALARARALAGADGAVLVTGSIHLVGELLAGPGEPPPGAF